MWDHLINYPFTIPLFISAVLLFLATGYSAFKYGKHFIHFTLFGLTLALVYLGQTYQLLFSDAIESNIWQRLYFVALSFLPFTYYWFSIVYLKFNNRYMVFGGGLFFGLSLCFSYLILFNLNFVTSTKLYSFGYYPLFGKAGYAFILYILLTAIFAFSLWMRALFLQSCKAHSMRLKWLYSTQLLFSFSIIDFLPNLGYSILPFGCILTALSFSLLTYTIYAYPLLQIKVRLTSFFNHLFSILILAFPLSLTALIALPLLKSMSQPAMFLTYFVIFMFVFPYAQSGVQFIENHFFKRTQHHYKSILQFSEEFVHIKNPIQLIKQVDHFFKKLSTPVSFKFIFKQIEKSTWMLWQPDNPLQLLPDSLKTTFNWFEKHQTLLTRYDVTYIPELLPDRDMFLSVLDRFSAHAMLPLVQGDAVLGFILIDTDAIEVNLTTNDILFLNRLKPLITIALNNVYLYDHIRGLSKELWDINENLHLKIQSKTFELETALSQMHLMHEEQKNFFVMSSHNLRTPLTSIKAAAAMLWKKDTDDFRNSLNVILSDNIKRLENLIDTIVEIARLEENYDLRFTTINMTDLIIDAFNEVSHAFYKENLVHTLELDHTLPLINGDKDHLKTVLLNLLSNAFKYSATNCTISISYHPATRERLQLYGLPPSRQDQSYNEIAITDNGEGIPHDQKQAIFNSFRQVKESHKRYQGSGLGLYISKRIIENHNGAITLESKLDAGSSFSFILPAGSSPVKGEEASEND